MTSNTLIKRINEVRFAGKSYKNANILKDKKLEIESFITPYREICNSFDDIKIGYKNLKNINVDIEIDFLTLSNNINYLKQKVNNDEFDRILLNTIKKSYDRIKKRLAKKDCSFKLKWIPRGANKIAHKYSYSAFQKLKQTSYKKDIILIEKESFLELLQKFNSRQCKVIIYLFKICNEDKFILKTQMDIARSLEISISYINKIFQELIKLNVLTKIKNGKYSLII